MKFFSVAFHPLLIATHLTGLVLITAPELIPTIRPHVYLHFTFLVFLTTGLLPALSIYILKKFNYISDFELTHKGERITPFIFIFIYYLLASFLFCVKLEMGFLFNLILISVTCFILLLTLITIKFKISIHAAAIWSAVGYLTGIFILFPIDSNTPLFSVLICAGLTSSSRLALGYHTPKQVWSGAILGFCFGVIVVITLL